MCHEQQLLVSDELSGLLRPGLRVILYCGPNGELLGIFIPELMIGQDWRQ
jgi:hypothetical protein